MDSSFELEKLTPEMHEMHETDVQRRRVNWRLYFIIAFLILFVLIVAIAVPLSLRDSDDDQGNQPHVIQNSNKG